MPRHFAFSFANVKADNPGSKFLFDGGFLPGDVFRVAPHDNNGDVIVHPNVTIPEGVILEVPLGNLTIMAGATLDCHVRVKGKILSGREKIAGETQENADFSKPFNPISGYAARVKVQLRPVDSRAAHAPEEAGDLRKLVGDFMGDYGNDLRFLIDCYRGEMRLLNLTPASTHHEIVDCYNMLSQFVAALEAINQAPSDRAVQAAFNKPINKSYAEPITVADVLCDATRLTTILQYAPTPSFGASHAAS